MVRGGYDGEGRGGWGEVSPPGGVGGLAASPMAASWVGRARGRVAGWPARVGGRPAGQAAGRRRGGTRRPALPACPVTGGWRASGAGGSGGRGARSAAVSSASLRRRPPRRGLALDDQRAGGGPCPAGARTAAPLSAPAGRGGRRFGRRRVWGNGSGDAAVASVRPAHRRGRVFPGAERPLTAAPLSAPSGCAGHGCGRRGVAGRERAGARSTGLSVCRSPAAAGERRPLTRVVSFSCRKYLQDQITGPNRITPHALSRRSPPSTPALAAHGPRLFHKSVVCARTHCVRQHGAVLPGRRHHDSHVNCLLDGDCNLLTCRIWAACSSCRGRLVGALWRWSVGQGWCIPHPLPMRPSGCRGARDGYGTPACQGTSRFAHLFPPRVCRRSTGCSLCATGRWRGLVRRLRAHARVSCSALVMIKKNYNPTHEAATAALLIHFFFTHTIFRI